MRIDIGCCGRFFFNSFDPLRKGTIFFDGFGQESKTRIELPNLIFGSGSKQKARDIVAKLQGKVTRFLLMKDAEPRQARPIPSFGEEALLVLLHLEYRRTEAESMIAEALAASVYRLKNRRAEAS